MTTTIGDRGRAGERTIITLDGDIQVEWPSAVCPCGDTAHARWIKAGTWTCELYPCTCLDRPSWAASCWYRHKTSGKMVSRCNCANRKRDERLPRDCCSWDRWNALYATETPGGSAEYPEAPQRPSAVDWAGARVEEIELPPPSDAEVAGAWVADPENPSREEEFDQWDIGPSGPVLSAVRAPYVRRFAPDECTCTCTTPWDGEAGKKAGGYHCTACHTNWTNVSTAEQHQRHLMGPCRPPWLIVDVSTNRPLLAPRDVSGIQVWGLAW
jgi:hypothetical protein